MHSHSDAYFILKIFIKYCTLKFYLCYFQGRNVVVFYGSQTGTAEDFAGRLAKDATRYGMKGMVADPEECEMVMSH